MANNPKKVKDPTEVALSAIQEALNIADAPPPPGLGSDRNEQKDRAEHAASRNEPIAPAASERLAPAFRTPAARANRRSR